MTPPPDPEPVAKWHRSFASKTNNEAWKLVENPIGRIDIPALLDAAHTSAWHWQRCGNELNHQRARMLLALAHALAGFGPSAMAQATEMRAYFLASDATPDWEAAFVHIVHAHAARAAGDAQAHAASYAAAAKAVQSIADPLDRDVVDRVFIHLPRP